MKPIAGKRLLNQDGAHAWRCRLRRFQASHFGDQPALRPTLSVEVKRNVSRLSINQEKNAPNSGAASPRCRVKAMDQLHQPANVIFVVVRESNERNPANADRMQPIGEAVTVRANVNERRLELASAPTRQWIDDRQTIALSDVQAVDTYVQIYPLSFRFHRP